MYKPALTTGALLAALAVILGAFGAHALKAVLEEAQLQTFETGVKYQFYHSFAMLITGIVFSAFPFKVVKMAAAFFLTGIILFSGSLYAMTLLKINGQVGLGGLGILTPIGGLFFIAGWLSLFLGFIRRKQ
jgi:uncharacterized membrane protein YgdD (TMEM256/DUF423 family)